METTGIPSSERYICLRLMGRSGSEWYLMDLQKLKKTKKNPSNSNIKETVLTSFLSLPIFDASACCSSTGKGFYFLGGYDSKPVIDFSKWESKVFFRCPWYTLISPPDDTSIPELIKSNSAAAPSQPEEEQKGSIRALKFDANKPDQGFMNIPTLPHPRSYAKSLAFKGKIYVFGGYDPKSEHFGECFDPELDTWTTIFSPAKFKGRGFLSQCGICCVAVPYDENQLLIGPFRPGKGGKFFWLYNVESKRWNRCPKEEPMHLSSLTQFTPVKVGSTFYYRRQGNGLLHNIYGDICALDLDSGLHYSSIVESVPLDKNEVIKDSHITNLFHLGGDNFCFFTIHATKSEPYTCGIHFNQVRAVKKCGGYMDINWVSKLYIPVAGNWQQIVEITPVDEIFVETLLPYIEKANVGKLDIGKANAGKWVSGIGVLGLLLIGGAIISSRLVRTGNK